MTGRSDYAHMLQKLILNYQVAAGWAAAAPAAKRAAVKEYPLKTTQTMVSFAVGDGHSGFNEGTIDENGMIRIRASDIVRLLGWVTTVLDHGRRVPTGASPAINPPLRTNTHPFRAATR